MKQIVGCYDVIQRRTRPVEIDPEIPNHCRFADGEPTIPGVSLIGFKAGLPVLHFWGVAAQFEKESLAAFQTACVGGAR